MRPAETDVEAPVGGDPKPVPSATDQRNAIGKTADEVTQAATIRDQAQAPLADEVVALIRKPWAKDANGSPIATSFDVTGSTLAMNVNHQGGQTAYPVVADMQTSDAEAIDEGSSSREAAAAPARDADDDATAADQRPDGSGTPPSSSAATSSSNEQSDARDYPDEGSGSEPTPSNDDRSETPEGASAPDPSSAAMSNDAMASSLNTLQVGTTESNGSTLTDPRNVALGDLNTKNRRYLRAFVPWNFEELKKKVANGTETRSCVKRAIATWDGGGGSPGYKTNAATLKNTEVMVVFTSQPVNCKRTTAPSATAYRDAIKKFLDAPGNEFIDRVTAWNEPNFDVSSVRSNPTRAAEYWKMANAYCATGGRCLAVPAGDVAAGPSFLKRKYKRDGQVRTKTLNYASEYRKSLVKHNGRKKLPIVWSFHAYGDYKGFMVNRSRTRYLSPQTDQYRGQFANYTYDNKNGDSRKPAIWNTEAAPFYRVDCAIFLDRRRCNGKSALRVGELQQAKAAAFLLESSVRPRRDSSPQVSRLYYYDFADVVGYGLGAGAGFSGRCVPATAPSTAQCAARDSGLIASDSSDNPQADESKYPTYDFPRRSPALSTQKGATRRAWCMLRFRRPGDVRSGTVTKCS